MSLRIFAVDDDHSTSDIFVDVQFSSRDNICCSSSSSFCSYCSFCDQVVAVISVVELLWLLPLLL